MAVLQDRDDAIVATETYSRPGAYDALFAELRRTDPAHWTMPVGHRPFWCVSKYADIQDVEMRSDVFLNAPRAVLRSIADEDRVRAQTGGQPLLLRNLINMDGTEHHAFRRLTQGWFAPARLKAIEADIRAIARRSIDRMLSLGGDCDFVEDVAVWYPLRVIMSILGLPAGDEPIMLKLTQQIFGPDDPDVKKDPAISIVSTVKDYFQYFGELTSGRRRAPRDDLASIIANAQIDGRPIGDHEAASYYIIIATAGHDTTSSTIAGGLLALVENPRELARLRADPSLLPSAVDEMLRWVTPVKHFFRTAAIDAEVRDQAIRQGDHLLMCYPSGNRDEDVFEDPFSFNITRSPNRHLAFGYGSHVCLGQHLAKLEIRVFFEELLARFDEITLGGDPAWLASNFVSGLKRMPIRYRALA